MYNLCNPASCVPGPLAMVLLVTTIVVTTSLNIIDLKMNKNIARNMTWRWRTGVACLILNLVSDDKSCWYFFYNLHSESASWYGDFQIQIKRPPYTTKLISTKLRIRSVTGENMERIWRCPCPCPSWVLLTRVFWEPRVLHFPILTFPIEYLGFL